MEKPRFTKKEIFSIPNILGYFRILVIPIFTWIYCTADSTADYYTAAAIVGISGLTDMFDGKIARKFNMITQLGKFIDPLADKLTQGALILCLAVRYPFMRIVLILFVIKEGFMAVMGLLLLPRGKKLDGAKWFGKVCTTVLYVMLCLLFLFPGIHPAAANVCIGICAVFLLFSFAMYIPVFRKMWMESGESPAECVPGMYSFPAVGECGADDTGCIPQCNERGQHAGSYGGKGDR